MWYLLKVYQKELGLQIVGVLFSSAWILRVSIFSNPTTKRLPNHVWQFDPGWGKNKKKKSDDSYVCVCMC